jgi:hypothetical protein
MYQLKRIIAIPQRMLQLYLVTVKLARIAPMIAILML